MVTPRETCERYFTHSNSCCGSRSSMPSRNTRCRFSQVSLCVSHTSVVSEPRTARAFSRAACMHE